MSPSSQADGEEGVTHVAPPPAAVYHLTLTKAPEECSHLVGRYKATVDHTSLHLVGVGADKRWSWCLEHIRRFSVRERDSQLVIETGRCALRGAMECPLRGAMECALCADPPTLLPQEGLLWRGAVCVLWGPAPPPVYCPEGADEAPVCGDASEAGHDPDTREDRPETEDRSSA